jgi:hypothetical protein
VRNALKRWRANLPTARHAFYNASILEMTATNFDVMGGSVFLMPEQAPDYTQIGEGGWGLRLKGGHLGNKMGFC